MAQALRKMNPLIDILPGLPIAVPDVCDALEKMWDPDGEAPSSLQESHATQVNLVLHFGLATTPKEAGQCFDIAVKFAQRYPCRIIVLCPQQTRDENELMKAKLFSQCYIGPTFREMCCCEAVIVGYNPRESSFLENQVSLWIENDLPIYHWLHRVPPEAIDRNYRPFLRRCTRIVYDYSIDGENYRSVRWPSNVRVRDLSLARTLMPRQALGQFFSATSPDLLVDGLRHVATRYDLGYRGEAGNLSCWQEYCIDLCRKLAGKTDPAPQFLVEPLEVTSPNTLEIEWSFAGGKFFHWTMRERSGTGEIAVNFGDGRRILPIQVSLLPPDRALSEALFFNDWGS